LGEYCLDTNPNKIDEVKWKDDWVEVDVRGRKSWKKGRLEWSDDNGLHRYQKWWKNRFLVTHQDYEPAADAIRHAADSSWWSWDSGLRPFHWRWPTFYQEVIRDGLKVFFQAEPPKYQKSQRDISDLEVKAKVSAKLDRVRARGYISPGVVESLTAFFAVPKGEDDIRLVCNGSVSELNSSLWVLQFFLPTIRTHLRAVDEGTYTADVDIGEMFLNFILHRELMTLAGVDLTKYVAGDGQDSRVWETPKYHTIIINYHIIIIFF
jgi:hypothetical protein